MKCILNEKSENQNQGVFCCWCSRSSTCWCGLGPSETSCSRWIRLKLSGEAGVGFPLEKTEIWSKERSDHDQIDFAHGDAKIKSNGMDLGPNFKLLGSLYICRSHKTNQGDRRGMRAGCARRAPSPAAGGPWLWLIGKWPRSAPRQGSPSELVCKEKYLKCISKFNLILKMGLLIRVHLIVTN
jgi:hypothetical protein